MVCCMEFVWWSVVRLDKVPQHGALGSSPTGSKFERWWERINHQKCSLNESNVLSYPILASPHPLNMNIGFILLQRLRGPWGHWKLGCG